MLELGFDSQQIIDNLMIVLNSNYAGTIAHQNGDLLIIVRHLGGDGKEEFRVELSDPTSLDKAEAFLRKWQRKR